MKLPTHPPPRINQNHRGPHLRRPQNRRHPTRPTPHHNHIRNHRAPPTPSRRHTPGSHPARSERLHAAAGRRADCLRGSTNERLTAPDRGQNSSVLGGDTGLTRTAASRPGRCRRTNAARRPATLRQNNPMLAGDHTAGLARATARRLGGCGRRSVAGGLGRTAPGWVVMVSPGVMARWQARMSGVPLTTTRQSKQAPMPQKTPRGRLWMRVVRQVSRPAARRTAATVWPARAGTGWPSTVTGMGVPGVGSAR